MIKEFIRITKKFCLWKTIYKLEILGLFFLFINMDLKRNLFWLLILIKFIKIILKCLYKILNRKQKKKNKKLNLIFIKKLKK